MTELIIINKRELTKVEYKGTDLEIDRIILDYNLDNSTRIQKVERNDTTIQVTVA